MIGLYQSFDAFNEFINFINTLLFIFLIIPLIISIFLAIWTYKDAKKRRMNAIVWVLILLLIPFFIGFILYLMVRDTA